MGRTQKAISTTIWEKGYCGGHVAVRSKKAWKRVSVMNLSRNESDMRVLYNIEGTQVPTSQYTGGVY